MDADSKAVMNGYYARLLKEHGPSMEALEYRSVDQQEKRYACLTNIEPMARESSVLDVGCGLGYLCDFLRKGGWVGKYTGIDVSSDMVSAAAKRLPNDEFFFLDILVDDLPNSYDYVFCGATIEHRPQFVEPQSYMKEMIRKMFSLSNKGLAFDIFSNRVDFEDEQKLYVDPFSLLTFCYQLTGRLILRNDYRPYEFVVYLYANEDTDDLNIFSDWSKPDIQIVQ